MLAHWHPIPMTRKRQKPSLTVADAWKFGVTYNNNSDRFTYISADLHCDTCGVYQALPRIVIGDSAYVKFMKYGEKYFEFEFILSFVYLVTHLSHIEASYAPPPFLQVLTYESQRLVKDDVLTVPRMHNTIVGVFHSGSHYAIAEVDHCKLHTITIYDGLFYDLSEWQKNVIQLLMKCNLIDLETLGIDLIADPKSKLIVPGHRHGIDVVNGYTIVANGVKWRLIRGTFIVQTDDFNCGPIACLKVMELFSRIDRSTAVNCYGKARIRKVVFDEWDNMVRMSDRHGSLTVKDTRRELPVESENDKAELSRGEPHLDNDASSRSSEVSSYHSSFDAECIEEDDENGLLFRPDCSSLCMTLQHESSTPCHLGHERVLHARLTHVGRYVLCVITVVTTKLTKM